MKNYREDILNNFIERYEKSSYYKGKSLKPQKSSIVLHERYPCLLYTSDAADE